MKYAYSLGITLFAVWLLWSGHYTPLLISLGVLSCLLVVAISHRMRVVDAEAHPVDIAGRFLLYLPWLLWAIVKANLDVARRILDFRLPISPRLIRVKASQKSDLGQVIYANSITLTPGTVSVDLEKGEILVHALTRECAEDLQTGEMDRRVAALEGAK